MRVSYGVELKYGVDRTRGDAAEIIRYGGRHD